MKFKKMIPLLAMVLAASACEQSIAQSQPDASKQSQEISSSLPAETTAQSQETSSSLPVETTLISTEDEAAKALSQAKADAKAYLDTCDPALYEGGEKSHIEGLIAEITSLLETATTAEQINTKVQELQTYLATAKTKAQYEEERAAAALAQAKTDAQTYLDSCDPALYEGEEKTHIEALIAEINGLLETATTPDQINTKVQELQTYLATAKTKAEYEAERAAKALADRKAERIKEVEIARPNQYRSEELAAIQEEQEDFTDDINLAESIEEVNAVSRQSFDNVKAAAKTNAAYMLDEMYSYRDPSAWSLVNEHAANYAHVAGSNVISVPDGTGFNGVGYLMSPVKYQGKFELSMKLQASDPTTSTIGLMFGNYHDRATGDGIDGYLINYDIATDHQYVQIWFLSNAYCTFGESVCTYIGGWVYNEAHTEGTLAERNIRVKYDGYNLHIMDDEEYLGFGEDNAIKITVPLALNNVYSIDPSVKSYSFGLLNWDGNSLDKLRGIYVDELTTASVTDSNVAARQIGAKEIAKINLGIYEDAEKLQLSAKIDEVEASYDNGTYGAIIAKVEELKVLVGTLKTHEQLEIERHRDISVEMLDGIYSDDPTKHTPSNWELVNEHGLQSWTHEQGSHAVVTNGDAGYILDADIHTDFTVVFKVTGTQAINPYNAAWPDSALIIGGNINGNYFTGYEIVLSQDWGFQLYDSMTGAVGDPGCYADQFKGGFDTNSEGVTYRLTVNNGILKVYVVDPATGNETQMGGVDSGFANATEWNVGNLSGHFGIMDWGGATTYEILEFRDL